MTAVFYNEKQLFGNASLVIDKHTNDHGILDDIDIRSTLESTRNVLYKAQLRSRMIKCEGYVPTVVYSTVFFADPLLGRIAHLKYLVNCSIAENERHIQEVINSVNSSNKNIPINGSLKDALDRHKNNNYLKEETDKYYRKKVIIKSYEAKYKALQKQYYECY